MRTAVLLGSLAVASSTLVGPGTALAAESRPDIVVERWSTPSAAPAGRTITVVVHLVNVGEAPSGRFANVLRLDPPVPGTALIEPAHWGTEPLKPGQSVKTEVKLPIPNATLPGEYVLRVIADASKAVAEVNEHNNLAERRLIVTAHPGSTPPPQH